MIHAFRFTITALCAFCALLSFGPLKAEVVATGFSPIIAAHSGKCLDATKAQTSSGTAITQYSCHGGDNQQWTVEALSPGFRVISKDTALCMVMSGGKLVQSTCTGSANELWLFTSAGAGFQIASQATGLCLTVDGASTLDLASLIQSTCLPGQSNQQWIFPGQLTTASTQNAVIARHSGQCLMVNGGSTAVGTSVMQFPCGGAANEQWSLKPVGSDYQLIASHSAQCLSVIGGAITPGAILVQSPCQTAPTQLWTPKPIPGGYQFVAKHSALCLTIPGGSMTAATTATQEACNSSLNQSWALSNPTPRSSWTGKLPMPIVAASAANLPNGKILAWAADGEFAFSGDTGPTSSQTYTAIFDPGTNTSTEALISATGANMFCTGTSLLPDGTILINGGSSSPKTSLYNPITDSWTTGAFMNIARGYQANTTLADGSVLTLGGSWSGPATSKIGEVWTTGVWGLRTGITVDRILYNDPQGIYRSDNHAWLFTTSGGKVFHAGPSKQMNWITTSGAGSIIDAGLRGDDADSVNGKAVMFEKGKILKTGGAPAYSNVMANSNSYVLDINTGVATRKIAPMAYARVFANGVVLPNGQVVVVGGQTFAGPFSDGDSVLAPELWDPVREVFTRLSPQMSPRVYHSVALLLPDGRVFSAGGGLCGTCASNHPDAEILSPPYLFNADGTPAIRPLITSVQTEIANGGTLSLTTDSPVSSFAIIRLSAATHSVNNDERRISLTIQSTPAPNSYVLSIPQDTGVALPGYYMLFAMNAAGTPSVAKTVHVGGSMPLPQGTNLALGKATTQSSNYLATTPAALAVDGNTNGDLNLGSVSHTGLDFQPFWQVDLGASGNLKEIDVWNRTDNFAGRLANFHVLVSDQPFAGNTLAQVQSQVGITDLRFAGMADSVSRFLINRPGRYVRVQLEGTDYLHMAEVQVFGTALQNSAPTVSITAPTTGQSFVAPASFTIAATAADVDNNLARVEFYNGAVLLGFNTIGPYNFNWANVAAGNYTLTVKAIDIAGLTASASVNVTVSSPLPQSTNLALGKVAMQSSNYTSATIAGLAVDGNTNGNYYSGSVTHTGLDFQPFWQVDLGSSGNLSEIVVWNRTDDAASRLANFHVLVSDQPFAGTTLAQVQAQAGITDLRFAGVAATVSRFPLSRTGRYVRVQLEGTDYLHLAEVQVFGSTSQNSAPTVAITAPTAGASFVAPASIVISAIAADVDNNLARVEFYNGATLLGQSTIAPYSFNWTNVAAGNYTITAKAVDASGLTAAANVNVTVSSPLPPAINLALGKTATQSSDYTAATPARLAVDGNTNGDLNVGSVAHTGLDSQPYWQVDLGASVNLSEIVIWNRTDSGTDRLTNFHVIISSFPISSRTLAKVQAQAGITDLYFAGTAGAVSRFPTTRAGRYIRVQLEGTNYLNLAEVQVFGTLAPNSAPVVSISTPTTGSKFVAPASITINAVATDVDSNLARVEFYNGAILVGQKTTTPYNFNLSNVGAGDYTITVKAIDTAGLSSSASVNVTVKGAN